MENKKELLESLLTEKGDIGLDDENFDHPYHVIFDTDGNKIYDGHSSLLKELSKDEIKK